MFVIFSREVYLCGRLLLLLMETSWLCENKTRDFSRRFSIPLLFVMCLFPLSNLLRDLQKGFIVDGIVISHLLYLDDLKLYSKSEEDMATLVNTIRIFSDNGMSFGFN